jgi:hypothetical protein
MRNVLHASSHDSFALTDRMRSDTISSAVKYPPERIGAWSCSPAMMRGLHTGLGVHRASSCSTPFARHLMTSADVDRSPSASRRGSSPGVRDPK